LKIRLRQNIILEIQNFRVTYSLPLHIDSIFRNKYQVTFCQYYIFIDSNSFFSSDAQFSTSAYLLIHFWFMGHTRCPNDKHRPYSLLVQVQIHDVAFIDLILYLYFIE
jgi:hypothetical protein